MVTRAFGLLIGAFYIASPVTFGGSVIYRSFLSTLPPVTLLALGLTFLIIMGQMDLSFPSVSALGAWIFAVGLRGGLPPWFAVGLALAAGVGAGWLNGILVAYLRMPGMIATIGTQFAWRGFLLLASDGLALPLASFSRTAPFQVFAGRIGSWMLPAQALWALVIAGGCAVALNRTPFGEAALFVGDNRGAAEMMGIKPRRVIMKGYLLMGFLAALAGLISTAELANWWPTQGDGYMLLAFAAVFVGGTSAQGGEGTVYGTAVGSLIIGIIEGGIVAAGLTGFWTRLIHGLVIITSVCLYSLLSRRR